MTRAVKPEEKLYREAKGGKIVASYTRVLAAVETSAKTVEQYPTTRYSRENAETLTMQATALRHLGAELRAWHKFLHHPTNAVEGFDTATGV